MNIDEIIDNYRCPITRLIYRHPVIIEDGYTYEKCAIERYLENDNRSPITREEMKTKKMTINRNVLTRINEMRGIEEMRYEKYEYYSNIYNEIRGGNYNNILKCKEYDSERLFNINEREEGDIIMDIIKDKRYGSHILSHLNNYNIKYKKEYVINYALRYSTKEAQERIIKKGVNLEIYNKNRIYPIHYAIIYSSIEIQKMMIERGVNLEVRTIDKWYPIHYALKYGTKEIQEILIRRVNLEVRTINNEYPIHIALQYGTSEIQRMIINRGVNLEIATKEEGYPMKIDNMYPIHYAIKYARPEIQKMIIERGVNMEIYDMNEMYPIHYAIKYSTQEIQKMIIERGVNLEVKDNENISVIHYALLYSTPEIQKMIIEKGVNLERIYKHKQERYKYGIVTRNKYDERINKKIKEYINNIVNKYKIILKPIHMAIILNNEEIIELILSKIKDTNGMILIKMSQEYSSERIQKMIKEYYNVIIN